MNDTKKLVAKLDVNAELKNFINDKGENVEYVALSTVCNGIPLKLKLDTATDRAVVRQYILSL